MGDTKDRVGAAGVIVAGGFFKIALYVCVAVLVIWIGKSHTSLDTIYLTSRQ